MSDEPRHPEDPHRPEEPRSSQRDPQREQRDPHRRRKKLRKLEERSDRRTADFLARRLEVLEEDLGELIPDLQSLSHYGPIGSVSHCLRTVADLKKRYRKFAVGHPWQDDDD
jgi:hypothetical protein